MTPEIWQDIMTRIKNLRGDMVGQWQGGFDDVTVERSVQAIGHLIAAWSAAKPLPLPLPLPQTQEDL